jgi:hypothetical protein
MNPLTRREFFGQGGAMACACAIPAGIAHAAHVVASPTLRELAHGDVRLDDSPLLHQFDQQQRLFAGLDDDALLKPFRSRAGLATPGADMGGWYDNATDFHVDPADWSKANWHGFIPGHSFGQYVSGLARGQAVRADMATRAKIAKLVNQFSATISPRFFDDYNLPAYTFDKLVVGLNDAWRLADVTEAREVLGKLTDTVMPFLPEKALTQEERRARPHSREAQLWDEPYTLPENLFLASRYGMGERYRPLAMRYLANESLFDPLAANRSPFKGKHAYSHVNSLSSAIQAYLVTGEDRYLAAARNGFAFIEAQSFATGGWGPNETLLAADDTDTLFNMLGSTHSSFETPCGAYGHFKIARSLLRLTRDSRYGDSMERVLYNTILGALPTQPNGDTFYYSDYNHSAHKFYRGEKWPCCSGTFVQLTADYGISSYFADARSVYVNLYVPSAAHVELSDTRVAITQTTSYPRVGNSRLRIVPVRPATFGLCLRIPAWAGGGTQVSINGLKFIGPVRAGTFLELRRRWQAGDVVEISFPMTPRLEPLNAAHPEMVAVLHGPRVLFPVAPSDAPLTAAQWSGAQPGADEEWVASSGTAHVTLKPFSAISGETYRLYSRLGAGEA